MKIMPFFFMRHLQVFRFVICLCGASLVPFLSSCEDNCVYHDYQHLTNSNWNSHDTLCFRIPITDSLAIYRLDLEMRHTTEFVYKEALIMLESHYGNQQSKTRLFCFPIVAEDGRWLGTGWGNTLQLSKSLGEYCFAHRDTLFFRIYHLMNEPQLKGISDVGLKVTKVSRHYDKK